MTILNLNDAITPGKASSGLVWLRDEPHLRPGRRPYLVGDFQYLESSIQFRTWEEEVIRHLQEWGPGIYRVEVVGQEYNGRVYLNVQAAYRYDKDEVTKTDFQARISAERLQANWDNVLALLSKRGLTPVGRDLCDAVIRDEALRGRFMTEGAAIRHHDNVVGGLWNHTTKMLHLLVALLDNNPDLRPHSDLLAFSITVHDIGKVFEYDGLEPGPYWYANHRVRGLEFLVTWRSRLIEIYDETFYRQVQSVIAGHHGEYGDRPTTVAAALVHQIDATESFVTELLREQRLETRDRLYHETFGFLAKLPEASRD